MFVHQLGQDDRAPHVVPEPPAAVNAQPKPFDPLALADALMRLANIHQERAVGCSDFLRGYELERAHRLMGEAAEMLALAVEQGQASTVFGEVA